MTKKTIFSSWVLVSMGILGYFIAPLFFPIEPIVLQGQIEEIPIEGAEEPLLPDTQPSDDQLEHEIP
jgi:hypothetical protein